MPHTVDESFEAYVINDAMPVAKTFWMSHLQRSFGTSVCRNTVCLSICFCFCAWVCRKQDWVCFRTWRKALHLHSHDFVPIITDWTVPSLYSCLIKYFHSGWYIPEESDFNNLQSDCISLRILEAAAHTAAVPLAEAAAEGKFQSSNFKAQSSNLRSVLNISNYCISTLHQYDDFMTAVTTFKINPLHSTL